MPSRLTENRDLLESLFVFGLWKDPKCFRSFRNKIASEEFFSSMPAQFYYNLGLNMFEKGYDEFDKVSVATTVNAMPGLATEYNKLGGFETYEDVKRGVKSENLEGVYNDITKLNCLTTLHEKGFNVLGNWAKMQKMNTEQIRRYFSFQLNDTFLSESTSSKIETLEITDDDITSILEGEGLGYSIAKYAPILNFLTLGLHKGITFVGAGSGTGKSSFLMGVLVRSWVKDGIKSGIISNEETIVKFKHCLVSLVAHEMFGEKALTRRRLKIGRFSSVEKDMLLQVKDKINTSYGKLISFVKLYDYSLNDVELIIDTLSARGIKSFLFDTFKSTDDGNAVSEMKEMSKNLFKCADRNEASIVCTIQLGLYQDNVRHLTMSTISSSKQVVEVADSVYLMRQMWDDEVTGAKHDIKPYRFQLHPKTGEAIKGLDGKPVKKFIQIEEGSESDYIILFLAKTRSGKRGQCLLYKVNNDYSDWKEIGYCNVGFADRGGKR